MKRPSPPSVRVLCRACRLVVPADAQTEHILTVAHHQAEQGWRLDLAVARILPRACEATP